MDTLGDDKLNDRCEYKKVNDFGVSKGWGVEARNERRTWAELHQKRDDPGKVNGQ